MMDENEWADWRSKDVFGMTLSCQRASESATLGSKKSSVACFAVHFALDGVVLILTFRYGGAVQYLVAFLARETCSFVVWSSRWDDLFCGIHGLLTPVTLLWWATEFSSWWLPVEQVFSSLPDLLVLYINVRHIAGFNAKVGSVGYTL